MALVAYGSSDESEGLSEDEVDQPKVIKQVEESNISDDEIEGSENFVNVNPLTHSLPAPSDARSTATSGSFVDENEDVSTIPAKKVYSNQKIRVERDACPKKTSIWSTKARVAKKRGPARIMAPSLVEDSDSDDEFKPRKVAKVSDLATSNSSRSHSLFAVLPDPKNAKKVSESLPKSSTTSPSSAKQSMLIPRSVARKETKKTSHDSDDDEPSSFFSLDDEKVEAKLPAPSFSLKPQVKANPDAPSPAPSTSSQPTPPPSLSKEVAFGPASAPYPPVGPGYDDADDLLANRDALERLQGGKQGHKNKVKNELTNVVDVNASDLTADPREWMTKALSEESDAPGPRCMIKGQTKRKHQITYLAALAKEKEHELKQQWANNAQNRRAAANKYGF